MTRSKNIFSRIGSVGKNLKRMVVISALLACSVSSTESNYNMRIHKNLVKETMDKNFRVILQHIQNKVQKDVFLTEINANIDNLSLQIRPVSGPQKWDQVETDLFFDQGQIVMEMAGLEYIGSGKITDPETGVQEKIDLQAKLDLCQVVMSLEQELTDEGNLYPKIEVAEVAFTLHPDTFVVNAQGELPLYKNRKFEEGIKKWMTLQIAQREQEFKTALQKSEREIMSSFAFKQQLPMGATASSSLGETMTLVGDHIVINYATEFEGAELNEITKKMRKIKTGFSDDESYMRDLQVVIDENYINYMLFQLFYQQKTYSFTDTLVEYMPEEWLGGGTALKAIMNTSVWSFLFPELSDEYENQRMDFRCGWNKDYLAKGKLENTQLSQIQFKDENMIDLNLHFGCGLYVYDSGSGKKGGKKSEIEQLMDLFQSMALPTDDEHWKEHISFFMSLQGEVDLEFSENAKSFKAPKIPGIPDIVYDYIDPLVGENGGDNIQDGIPMIFGIMKDFRPSIKELKVYDKNGAAMLDKADELNKKIMNWQDLTKTNEQLRMVSETVFNQGLPMVPFPDVARCLGLTAKDSTMKIKEGYAIMAFDYSVKSSNENCLFNMKQSLTQKEARMASKLGKIGGMDFGKIGEKMMKEAAKTAMSGKLPPLGNIPGMEGVQDKIDLVLEGYDRIQDFKNKMGDTDLLGKMDGLDPTKMDLGNILDQGQLGIDMIKNADEAIKSLNNPMINDVVNKMNDNEMMKKLKDVDMNEIKNKADNLKKGAEGLFNLFQ